MSTIIKYKTSFPTKDCLNRILNGLKQSGISATGEFINEIPRHNLITITLSDDISKETIFEIGVLVGSLDFCSY